MREGDFPDGGTPGAVARSSTRVPGADMDRAEIDTMLWSAAMLAAGLLTLLVLAAFVWFCEKV
jgi:hypothetical protein